VAWLRLLVLALGLVEGSWMTFDGVRALTVSDYVTPSDGAHAGQLGPWHHVVSAAGIPPRSTAMKVIFVVYGLGWLTVTAGFALRVAWAWQAMSAAAVVTLWYLPVGTLFGIIQLAALFVLRRAA
jgi:hypothetical protein